MIDFIHKKNPLVSIIVPAYNRADYIAETIQSVIDQTYTNWELVIVDDGSSDNTKNVISGFHDPRIRYHYIPHSGILGVVRNTGFRNATGDLIAWHDSDDLWRADKLTYQVDLFNQYPQAAFIHSNGDEFGDSTFQTPDHEPLFFGQLFRRVLIDTDFCFYVPSLIFRREVMNEIGLQGEWDSTLHDIHFYFKMSYRFAGIFSNERLIKIRKHKKSHSSASATVAYKDTIPMLTDLREKDMITPAEYRHLMAINYYKLGLVLLFLNEPSSALLNFINYRSLHPFDYKGYIRIFQAFLQRARNYFLA